MFLVTVDTSGHIRPVPATIYISEFCKIIKKFDFFRIFECCPKVIGNIIYGRKSAIWVRESVRKRYRTQILYLEHILRKSKKIVIFDQKNHIKNFQSRFFPADLSRTTNQLNMSLRYIPSDPPPKFL